MGGGGVNNGISGGGDDDGDNNNDKMVVVVEMVWIEISIVINWSWFNSNDGSGSSDDGCSSGHGVDQISVLKKLYSYA